MCKEMKEAGIIDPETREGIVFCTENCPYPEKCQIYDINEKELKKRRRGNSQKAP